MKKILLISIFLVNNMSIDASQASYSPWLMHLSQQVLSNLSKTGNSIFKRTSDHLNDPINLFIYSIVGTMIALQFVKPVSDYRELQDKMDKSYKNSASAGLLRLEDAQRFPLLKDANASEQQVTARNNQNNALMSYQPGKLPFYSQVNALTASIIEIFGDMFGLDRSLRYKFLPYTKDQEDVFNELDLRLCDDDEPLTDEETRWFFYLKPLLALGGKKGTLCISQRGSTIRVAGDIQGVDNIHTIYYTENNAAIENGSAHSKITTVHKMLNSR